MNFVPLQPNMWSSIPDIARPRQCEDSKGIVAIDDNRIVAVTVLDSWAENSCMIHIWIENPMVLKHGYAEEVFNFVFNTGGRDVIIGSTPANNHKALKFIKHIGFEEIARIPDGFERGVDYVITTMRREKCRWIKPHLKVVGGN